MKIVKLSIFVLLLLLSASFAVATDASAATQYDNYANAAMGTTTAVYFIDVGQGDSELIMTSDGKNILIDAGPQSGASAVTSFLVSHGATTLDALIISHPDADHLGGADEVLAATTVRSIYHPGMAVGTQAYTNFITAANAEGCPIYTNAEVNIGDYLPFGSSVSFRVMAINEHASSSNDASIVIKVTDGTVDFLFTGDASSVVEGQMVAYFGSAMDIDVLKVGHHGSSTSTSNAFLDVTSPDVAVIEVGASNSYGHPTADALSRLNAHGTAIYRTDLIGTIATTNGSTFSLDDATVPSAPQNLRGVPESSQIRLRWDAPADNGGAPINGYMLYRSTASAGPYNLISSPSSIEYLDAGLINGQAYWYKISAINILGEGVLCSAISATLMQTDYTYSVFDGEATITDYTGAGGTVVIPSELGGFPVVAIGDEAFYSCNALTAVTMPDGIAHIGELAFASCPALGSITFGSGLTSIGYLGFNSCSSLISVTIPSGVISIGSYAFGSCDSLTAISVEAGNVAFTSLDGVLYDKGLAILIQCPTGKIGEFIMPASATNIADRAFENCNSLTSVVIGNGVKSIGVNAFRSAYSLGSVTIPEGVLSIGDSAFESCRSLASIAVPDSVTSIGREAFWFCTSLTSATIGQGVESIGSGAFQYCTSINSIIIPGGVITIGAEAFTYCNNLLTIIFPGQFAPTAIDVDWISNTHPALIGRAAPISDFPAPGVAFHGLMMGPLIGDDYRYTLAEGRATITEYAGVGGAIALPSMLGGCPVVAIGDNAFNNAHGHSITSIALAGTLESIGVSAFAYCTHLESITIPDSVTSIGNRAFYACYELASATIGNGVSSIEDSTFYWCTALSSVSIPDSVSSIGPSAFSWCGLTSVNIPANTTSIGIRAFEQCYSLTSVNIPNRITSIANDTFSSCYSLTSVVIPDSVEEIGEYAFFDCSSLISVTIGEYVTIVGRNAFYRCTSLTSVIIPDNVETVGPGAFAYCHSLENVTMGAGVALVGDYAFYQPTSLTSIVFLGLVAPTIDGEDWISESNERLSGHAYATSNFPSRGSYFNGLLMGAALPSTPGAPIRISIGAGNAIAHLSWAAPTIDGGSAIIEYRIYRSDAAAGIYTLLVSPISTSYDDVGLSNGQTYWYYISAVNSEGEGEKSPLISATPYTVPSIATILTATPGSAQIALIWTNPAFNGGREVDYFIVYQDGVDVAHPTTNWATIVGLSNGREYCYAISAHNFAGEGSRSNTTRATPCGVPEPPIGLESATGHSQITLNWTTPVFDGGQPLEYFILYQNDIALPDRPVGLSCTITGLNNGQSYHFAVAAHNSVGNSTRSSSVVAMPATVPDAPTGFTAVSETSIVLISWQAPTSTGGSPITGYVVYREGNILANVGLATLAYVDTNGTIGTNYTYFVVAINAVGTGANSATASASPQSAAVDNTMLYVGIAVAIIVVVTAAVVVIKRKK